MFLFDGLHGDNMYVGFEGNVRFAISHIIFGGTLCPKKMPFCPLLLQHPRDFTLS